MIFVKVSTRWFATVGTRGAYVGGSTAEDLAGFKAYINGKGEGDFGTCKKSRMQYCYYAKVTDVRSAEETLLRRGFECNIATGSNIEEGKAGYIYVVTRTKRH